MVWPIIAALGKAAMGSALGGAAQGAAGGAAKGGGAGAASTGLQSVMGQGSIGQLGMSGMSNLAQGSGLMGGGGFNPMQMAQGALEMNAFNNKGGMGGVLGEQGGPLQNLMNQGQKIRRWEDESSRDATRQGPFPSTFIT